MKRLSQHPGFRFVIIADEPGAGGRLIDEAWFVSYV
jgi:hypothetical protein